MATNLLFRPCPIDDTKVKYHYIFVHDDDTQAKPSWDALYELAVGQEGLFSTQQAKTVGYSKQMLAHFVRSGRLLRVRRGIYRLVHFPPGDHEDLVVVWLWSEQVGLISHQTALALHQLSDVLPAKIHLTVPARWMKRRLRVPEGVVLHYGDVAESDRAWASSVPVTSPARTVIDCAQAGVAPDLIVQAIDDGVARGLFTEKALARALAFLNLAPGDS